MPDREVDFFLRLLDEAYDRKAWHGPNLRGALHGLTARQAAWRPAPGRHNIWELAVHAAYWKYAVRRRVLGEKRGSFGEPGSNWFERSGARGERAWRADRARLDQEHQRLRAAVAGLDPQDLWRSQPRATKRLADYILGAALHDVYHTGQVRLLKTLEKRGKR